MNTQDRPTATQPGPLDLAVINAWPAALMVGLVTIAVGLAVLAWPDKTLTVLSVLLGIQLLLFGLFRLISAFSSTTVAPGLVGFVGVIGMVAGVVVLRHPFETVAVLAALLGVAWIIGGAIELMSAITDGSLNDRGLLAFSAVLSIAAGIVVVAWPAPTITVIAWIAGLYLVVFGIILSIGAFKLRSLEA